MRFYLKQKKGKKHLWVRKSEGPFATTKFERKKPVEVEIEINGEKHSAFLKGKCLYFYYYGWRSVRTQPYKCVNPSKFWDLNSYFNLGISLRIIAEAQLRDGKETKEAKQTEQFRNFMKNNSSVKISEVAEASALSQWMLYLKNRGEGLLTDSQFQKVKKGIESMGFSLDVV